MRLLLYLLPILPLLLRTVLVIKFRKRMGDYLSEEELDRADNRSLILAFAGFSFTGVTALAVLETSSQAGFRFAIFYLLISFLTYLWALNLQSYKATRWQNVLADALAESGSFCLVLALSAVLMKSSLERSFIWLCLSLAMLIWFVDELIRLNIEFNYLRRLRGN